MDHRDGSQSRGGGGRDADALECIVCAPSHISDDIASARDQVRWFPAMVSTASWTSSSATARPEIPEALTDFVKARKFYDYKDHGRVRAKRGELVTDGIATASA